MSAIERDGKVAFDWGSALRRLEGMRPGQETDEYIDFLVGRLLLGAPAPSAGAIQCVWRSNSPFTLQRAALALALTADADDHAAVDALIDMFKQKHEDGYLAPAILEATGILAIKNPLARAEVKTILLRLNPSDDRYFLVRAAKVIGWIEGAFGQGDLLGKLEELRQNNDPFVQSEARYQLAMMEFARALLAGNRNGFLERVSATRAAFDRSLASEEHRPDSAIFLCLMDMLLPLIDPRITISEAESKISTSLKELKSILNGEGQDGLRDYRSDHATLLASRVLTVADALSKAASKAMEANDWLDIENAILDLAALYGVIRSQRVKTGLARIDSALSEIASTLLAPRLGPVVQRAVGRRKLDLVIEGYSLQFGEDDILKAMEVLREHVVTDEDLVSSIPEELLLHLDSISAKTGNPADELWRGMAAAIQGGTLPEWAKKIGLVEPVLPLERPTKYGADPSVDEVVRHLLRQLVEVLGAYDPIKWDRLVQAIEKIVSFVKGARDRLPNYLKCSEDGGLGQTASEDDLKNDLFEVLRRDFGPDALYEPQRIAGGRSDSGLKFEECYFPIEAKHTFQSVDPSHIKADYLPQVDTYAAAKDRVAILLVLDLRSLNAASHRQVRGKSQLKREQTQPFAMYPLHQSFWVDHLPLDPDLPHAKPNALIVGLVPGNQCLPSSKSVYSERPAKARALHNRITPSNG